MPVNQPPAPENMVQNFLQSIPPITRAHFALLVFATLAFKLGLDPVPFVLIWPQIYRFQVWRLLTNFLFLKGNGFRKIMVIIHLVMYGKQLEMNAYSHSSADYLFMILFGAAVMLVTSWAVPFFATFTLAVPMVEMVVYVWSRNYPTTIISIFGIFSVPAFYMPALFIVLDMLMDGDWKSTLLGILVGHIYHFLWDLHPAAGGRRLLNTPMWLKRAVLRMGIGNVPRNEVPLANPSAPGFRAFSGRGRRLQ